MRINEIQLNEINLHVDERIIIVGDIGAGKTYLLNQIRKALMADNNPATILTSKGNKTFLSNSQTDFDGILNEINLDNNYTGKNYILLDEEDRYWLDDFKILDKLESDVVYAATMHVGRGTKLQEAIENRNVAKYFSKIIICSYPSSQEYMIIDKKDENTFNWSHYERSHASRYSYN
ncbi:ATP-binding protein [Lysinibacillus fusiformis]|uniref:ATP-binding protein n=1 Tax=Lysinibacillus fusiformis TaxID=28031 RepID=UPI0021BFB71A|nr:ATP-binding protein [Lysinibacillus fusiformis]UXJ71266.1 ATP-binding protein [Lysinibacillus fusiformis]